MRDFIQKINGWKRDGDGTCDCRHCKMHRAQAEDDYENGRIGKYVYWRLIYMTHYEVMGGYGLTQVNWSMSYG